MKQYLKFIAYLMLFLVVQTWTHITKVRLPAKLEEKIGRLAIKLSSSDKNCLVYDDLIRLTIRNMLSKKTRTLVTIGGMAIGIGTIVFLVSIGYGMQKLVVTRVAKLEEMTQLNVSIEPGSQAVFDDQTLNQMSQIKHVTHVLPLISVVGHITFKESSSDIAIYGVTQDYLNSSAIKPIKGEFFDSNATSMEIADSPKVSGVQDNLGECEAVLRPDQWYRVRSKPDLSGEIIGYTRRDAGNIIGQEVWGGSHTGAEGGAKWLEADYLLWEKNACLPNATECERGGYRVQRDEDNYQIQTHGYVAITDFHVVPTNQVSQQVLGVSDGDMEWVEIASESANQAVVISTPLDIPANALKVAVVNQAVLRLMGLTAESAINTALNISFITTNSNYTDTNARVVSNPAEYRIVAVTPDQNTPIIYVPFTDVRSLGITRYSQAKILVDDTDNVALVRRQIEAMGYMTRSVADTVAQINNIFTTARVIFALLGTVAVSIAALGMFNTLTVSLLERTREVGLLKALGMNSWEIQALFLSESLIMGIVGGVLGIVAGYCTGKLLCFGLSIISLSKGVGWINMTQIPFSLICFIIALSLVVGFITGFYPAKRATRISALNALRYE